jgi:hypothetical protein
MKFSWFRVLPVITVTVTCGMFSAASRAELLCNIPNYAIRDLLPQLPRGCQPERIQGTGGLSFGLMRSAETLAEEAWRREVLTKYGERYQDIRVAACNKSMLCVKGAVGGSRRCTIYAFPCASDMSDEDRRTVAAISIREDRDGGDRPPYGGDRPPYGGDRPPYGGGQPGYSFLSQPEIIEVQQFLGVTPDGVWGPQSQERLYNWRRSAGLRSEGPPNRQDLEMMRRRR